MKKQPNNLRNRRLPRLLVYLNKIIKCIRGETKNTFNLDSVANECFDSLIIN